MHFMDFILPLLFLWFIMPCLNEYPDIKHGINMMDLKQKNLPKALCNWPMNMYMYTMYVFKASSSQLNK